MLYKSLENLWADLKKVAKITQNQIKLIKQTEIDNQLLDKLAYNISLNEDKKIKENSYSFIKELAAKKGIFCSSIHNFYLARGEGEIGGFTVPAFNLRGFTYQAAQALLHQAIKNQVGAFIFEIARSEINYTNQSPIEYVGVILAAAIREGFKGPIFFQGDHFQIKLKKFKINPEEEKNNLKQLIKEAVAAGFYNIDLDTSTLVDLTQNEVSEQQRPNFELAAELTKYIREIEPKNITISIGAEIGEIGGKNSTPEELRAFMNGYLQSLSHEGDLVGISKISVQTGTTHGGIVLPDGRIAEVDIDFKTLADLSEIARKEYGLAGAVQHGASTLPEEMFSKFPETETAEIHLATGFQNIIYDSQYFPKSLKDKMYQWIKENCQAERKPEWTDEQFYYKLRKKAWGVFKKEIWNLSPDIKEKISQELSKSFSFFFNILKVNNTKDLIQKYL